MPKKKKQQKPVVKRAYIDVKPLPRSLDEVNFKNVELLKRFVSDRFKIYPRKLTRVSSKFQRKLSREIKKARIMGLLPFTERH